MAAKNINDDHSDHQTLNPEMAKLNVDQEILKHPLLNSWTLWLFKFDKSKKWEENQREILTFNTVEDFWLVYGHLELASRLQSGCDYSLFKEGIKPMWEDARNRRGGRWILNLDKKQRGACLDKFWLEVMLCLIGETFESTLVNGAVVNIRNKGDKLSLWLGDTEPGESVIKIGVKLKERLGVNVRVTLGFEAHQNAIIKSGSTAKNSSKKVGLI